jgi:DNA-binding response OmpR family regulator
MPRQRSAAIVGGEAAMRVLLIEDDRRLARLVARVLGEEHFTVDLAHEGETGLEMALTGAYDVVVVDWMLPGRDGPAICRAVRRARLPTALLMLTARDQVEDKVAGFDAGADDYLVKPFAFAELVARVRALGRRFTPAAGDGAELRVGDLVLDLKAHVARRGQRAIELSPTEWNLLEVLARHPGQVLSRDQILLHAWPDPYDVRPTAVDVYVAYLRRKLGAPDPIRTVRGVGYRLEASPA